MQAGAGVAAGRVGLSRWSAAGALLLAGLRAHMLFFGVVALYAACAVLVSMRGDMIPGPSFAGIVRSFFTVFVPIQLLAIIVVRFIRLAVVVRPKHPTIALLRDLRDFFCQPSRAVSGLMMTTALFAFIKVFAYLKGNVPLLNPFSWDPAFIEWDAWLHFGVHPWEWLQPVLGYAPVTFAVNVGYNVWFIVMWVFLVGFSFTLRPSVLRTQFLLTFMLVWSIGGSLLAVLLSSAGPAFVARLGLPDVYAPLMTYLNAAGEQFPIWALNTQNLLWAGYMGDQNVVTGITAMPSMHNASSLLFALAAWRLDRRLGLLFSAYAFLIFLGSVHLAWHYAIDAYLAFAVTLAAWWVAGRVAVWYEGLEWSRAYARACAQSGRGA